MFSSKRTSKSTLQRSSTVVDTAELKQQSSVQQVPTRELQEWLKPLFEAALTDFIPAMEKLDKDYFAKATANPQFRKQLKKDFNEKLEKLLKVLKRRKDVTHEIFAELFYRINNSPFLNIHKNPRTDMFFKITKTTSKQIALGMIRHVALDVFNAQMKSALISIQQEDEMVLKTEKYQKLMTKIASVARSNLFSLQRSNWPVKLSESYRNIQSGIHFEVERAMIGELRAGKAEFEAENLSGYSNRYSSGAYV